MGVSQKTVRRYLDELEKRLLIEQERRGQTKSNRYYLHPAGDRSLEPPNCLLVHDNFHKTLTRFGVNREKMDDDDIASLFFETTKAEQKAALSFLKDASFHNAAAWLAKQGLCAVCRTYALFHIRKDVSLWGGRVLENMPDKDVKAFLYFYTPDELARAFKDYTADELASIANRVVLK